MRISLYLRYRYNGSTKKHIIASLTRQVDGVKTKLGEKGSQDMLFYSSNIAGLTTMTFVY